MGEGWYQRFERVGYFIWCVRKHRGRLGAETWKALVS